MTTRTCPTCLTPIPPHAAFCGLCGAPSSTRILTPSTSGGVRTDLSSSSYAAEPDRLQRALGSNYQLGDLIGRGGYAEVFAVRDLKLNRDLAIKVLRPDLIMTKSLLARFRREAEAVAALHHPGIVPIYDVGQADGIGFIVMPLIHGQSLKKKLLTERRLPIAETRRILLEAADALAAAHAAGVVHRDIKPENIMLEGADGRVLLMDFGIAKAVDHASDHQLTATGVIVGTPQYMSPEQACGDPNVDQRSDQYSLAVVGYQMLSGQVPFEGETARAIMAKQMLDEPAPLWELVETIPASMMDALERALAKDPSKRFPSIGEFATALGLDSGPASPGREKAKRAAARQQARRNRPWLVWTTSALALAMAGVAFSQWRPQSRAVAPESPASVPSRAPDSASQSAIPPAPVPPAASRTEPNKPVDQLKPKAEAPAPPPPPLAVVSPPPAPSTATEPSPSTSNAAPPPSCLTSYAAQDWATAYSACRAEAKENVLASRYAGILLAEGRGGPEDKDGGVNLLLDAAQRGDQEARVLAGRQELLLAKRAERSDPSLATELYLKAAMIGIQAAFPALATRYDQGLGVPQDSAKAVEWYRRAAQSGDVQSQTILASKLLRGLGVRKDETEAANLFLAAAKAGNLDAAYQIGLLMLAGKGIARDDAEGLRWIDVAARAGHADAKRELAKRQAPD